MIITNYEEAIKHVNNLMEQYQPMSREGVFDLLIKKGNNHTVSYDGLKMSAGPNLGFSLNHYSWGTKSGIYDGEDVECSIDINNFESLEINGDLKFKIYCNRVDGWGKGFTTKWVEVIVNDEL